MTVPVQLGIGFDAPHRNQYLFSDHYLNTLLPTDPRWIQALDEATDFLTWLQTLYRQEQNQLPHYNESQLEEHWFRPILTRLGHTFELQASIPGLDQDIKRPDYIFFPNEAARQATVSSQKTSDYTSQALAVGEVKQWDVPLGKKQKGGGASFDAQNPSFQIDYYLRTTDLKWGLLSNGRLWRLVHADTSQRLSIYYELDLVDLLSEDSAGHLRYFTLFFGQAAFQPDSQGRLFLADALSASQSYAVALEEDLQQNVYQALEQLMQGFLDLPANKLSEADLPQIYQSSLYLLYRLLFILYGESRELLPLDNLRYRDHYSLDQLKRECANLPSLPAPLTRKYWQGLQELFRIINGDEAVLNKMLGVPRYNGGLFDPNQHPFLVEKAVGDQAVVMAINLLALRQTESGPEFVDYRTLGVRQLGSIYEGLLEYQPRYATEPMAAIREPKGKGERWVKASAMPKGATVTARREPHQIYLETDRGERKATGSYYTPQYIVEYIVQNTLGPLVETARARVKERAKQAKSQAAQTQAEQSLIEEILNLKVLDPAMGSGHFLVEATEFLALSLATDPYVEVALGRPARSPRPGRSEGSEGEDDLAHWRRRVVERCIYGVDKNPLAMELAKLSLWLATVAAEKPLSFIDHHLKCGDALVGARVADLGEAPPVLLSKKAQQLYVKERRQGYRQANLFEQRLSERLPVVMGKILEIIEVESDSYDTVQAKEAADRAVQQLKAPFEAVANLWVSAYFNHTYNGDDYAAALEAISQPEALLAQPTVAAAQVMAEQRRFFHWELAFPEVFYDRHGQPLGERAGFDAVIGNPPYDELSEDALGRNIDEKEYLLNTPIYTEASTYRINLYRLFIAKAIDLTRLGGRHSYIVPMSLLGDRFTFELRRRLLTLTQFELIEAFPQKDDPSNRVFLEAKLPTCLYILSLSKPETAFQVRTHPGKEINRISPTVKAKTEDIIQFDPENYTIPLMGERAWSLAKKLAMSPNVCQLGELATPVSGEIIFNKQFRPYLTTNPKDALILRGGHVQRYQLIEEPKQGEPVYLNVKKFLAKASPGTSAYDHQKSRVVYQESAALDNWRRIIATYLPAGSFCGHKICYFKDVKCDDFALLAIFNSSLLEWRFRLVSTTNNLSAYQISALPFPRINFTTPTEERERLAVEAQQLYKTGQTEEVMAFTKARLAAQPEQADVIHDLLAYLAEQMIEMNKEKQNVATACWLDVEGVTDAATFARLRDKGKQEASLWSLPACQPYVRQDSHSSRSLEDALAWDEAAFKAFVKALTGSVPNLSQLVKVYQAHSPTYSQLVARLAATDRLIDQIVYQLYDLTEEEIRIVEGKGPTDSDAEWSEPNR